MSELKWQPGLDNDMTLGRRCSLRNNIFFSVFFCDFDIFAVCIVFGALFSQSVILTQCSVDYSPGKPLTHSYNCHQAVKFGTRVSWEVSRDTMQVPRVSGPAASAGVWLTP